MNIVRFLPLSYLSWLLGLLANLPLPQPLARWTITVFARAYTIDLTTATKSLDQYRSIGDFFTRDLKPEARPIGEGFVCPVDGMLRDYFELSPGMAIPQVKGKHYSLQQLLGGDPLASRLECGALWNLYLSPSDAHHIFAPVSGRIVKTVHIPGKLWPVNDWALNSVEGLFTVNERIVTFIESERGLVAVVMVGATNVGQIALHYMDLQTNTRPWVKQSVRSFDHAEVVARKGAKLGTFRMGSSVIVVAEAHRATQTPGKLPHQVCYGETL